MGVVPEKRCPASATSIRSGGLGAPGLGHVGEGCKEKGAGELGPPTWEHGDLGREDHLPMRTVTQAGEDHLPGSMVTRVGEDRLPGAR